jgi:hypothetical protein
MIARRIGLVGAVLSLVLPGCVVEQRDFEALRDQVRIQQKQINDLKARQEEQGLRVDTLNNGFKIPATRPKIRAPDRRACRAGKRADPAACGATGRSSPDTAPPGPAAGPGGGIGCTGTGARSRARDGCAGSAVAADEPAQGRAARAARAAAGWGDHHRGPQGGEALRRALSFTRDATTGRPGQV